MSPRLAGAALAAATTTAAALSLPPASVAQAWLPPRGEATLSLGLQRISAADHVFSHGERVDRGRMSWHHALPDLSYGVTDRFALRVTLPYVISRYDGVNPHRPGGQLTTDDGNWHGTFQDLRLEAKYMATTGSVVLTPFLAVVLPATSYETHAHAAAGRHLREVMAGVYAGRRLDPLLPEAYAHARYSFAVPERVLHVSNNRSNASLELGYFVTPRITVRTLGNFQKSHGGWRIPEDAPPGSPLFPFHDQLARDDSVTVGAGASMAVTGSIDVSVMAFRYVAGRNTTAGSGVSVGVGWGFSPAQLIRKRRGPPADGTDPS